MIEKISAHFMETHELIKHFGLLYGFCFCFEKIKPPIIGNFFARKRINMNKQYLSFKYRDYLINHSANKKDESNNRTIWIYWAQGFENAPDIIKVCVNSVKINAKNCEIKLLDQKNIKEYLSIPEVITSKYANGIISNTEYADIIRCNLLNEYGGLWLDGTVLLSGFDESIFDYKFWTVRRNYNYDILSVSYYRWNTAILHGDNSIFGYLVTLFNKYWEDHNHLLDYFLIDYFLDLIYDTLPECRKMMDAVPINNDQEFELQEIINDKYDTQKLSSIFSKGFIHKLQRRRVIEEMFKDNSLTYYGYLKQLYEII